MGGTSVEYRSSRSADRAGCWLRNHCRRRCSPARSECLGGNPPQEWPVLSRSRSQALRGRRWESGRSRYRVIGASDFQNFELSRCSRVEAMCRDSAVRGRDEARWGLPQAKAKYNQLALLLDASRKTVNASAVVMCLSSICAEICRGERPSRRAKMPGADGW